MKISRLDIHSVGVVLAATGLVACGGCYDSHALLEQVKTDAQRNQLHEVDLGFYRTTMPHEASGPGLAAVEVQLFGTVPQYRISAIEKQLKADNYRLRFETIEAIRSASRDELAEPDLTRLRARLTKVANGVLEDAPIQSLGIEKFRVVYQ
jgi:hypothetical protein